MTAGTRGHRNPLAQRVHGIPLWALALAALIPALVTLGLVLVYLNELIALLEDLVHYLFAPQSRAPREVIACSASATCRIVQPIVFTALFLFTILTGFAYTTLLERKLIAWFQQRVGPNRVGPGGFMQPAADGVKLIFKEDIQPAGIYRFVYLLAPLLKVVAGADRAGGGAAGADGRDSLVRWQVVRGADGPDRCQCRRALAAGHHQPGHLWRHPGRLGEQ